MEIKESQHGLGGYKTEGGGKITLNETHNSAKLSMNHYLFMRQKEENIGAKYLFII